MQKSRINNMMAFCESINRLPWLVLMFLLTIGLNTNASSADFQDAKPLKTKVTLNCIQMEEGQVLITAKIRAKVDKKYVGLSNVELEVYILGDSTNTLLEKKISDKAGNISLLVNKAKDLQLNEEGYYGILVSFNGDDKHKADDSELLFKGATMDITAEVKDSVKTITILLKEAGEEALPLEDVEVAIEVPRMFSNLPIAAESTDEEGILEIVFPDDLVGGETGTLEIIAKVEDTDDYASLQNVIKKDWGIPLEKLDEQNIRTLWSPDAPLWMVLTFAILMALVWGHFFVIIYKLNLIRKEGKSMETS